MSWSTCWRCQTGNEPANILKIYSRGQLWYKSDMAVPKTSASIAKAFAFHDCKPAAVSEYCSPVPKQFAQAQSMYIFSHCICFMILFMSHGLIWMHREVSLYHLCSIPEVLDCFCLTECLLFRDLEKVLVILLGMSNCMDWSWGRFYQIFRVEVSHA